MVDRVDVNPNILGGKPVIRGTRVPVYLILELLAAGTSQEAILKEYPQLKPEDIAAAVQYASSLLQGEVVKGYGE